MIRTQFHAIRSKFLAVSTAVAGLVFAPASVHAQSHPVGGGVKDGGFLGEYYNTATLPAVGTPPTFSRRDVRVEFTSSTVFKPGGSLRQAGYRDLTADNYSVRWSGELLTQFSETYTFKVTADDGARLYLRPVGGSWTTVIDAWSAPATTTGTFAMTRGTSYEVKLEYKETTGSAACVLKWSSSSTPEEVIEPLNVAGINAETHKDEWFADMIKVARDEYLGSDYNNRNTWPARDANGWPRGDFSQIIWEGRPSSWTGGTYLLKFKGKAQVNGSFGDANFTAGGVTYGQGVPKPANAGYDAGTNTTTATVVLRPTNIFSLSMSQTQRTAASAVGTGVTEIQFFRPLVNGGATPYDGTSEWRPDSLALYAPFTTLRMLSANFVSHSSWTPHPDTWTDNHVPNGQPAINYYPDNTCRIGGNYAQQTSRWDQRGMPSWERQVEMANLTGKDLYITINYKADADYVTKLAQLMRYGSDGFNPYTSEQANPVFAPLNPNLKVYVEWSNEMWNFAFQQFFDLLTDARAILANPAHAYHPIVKYDNLDVAPRGDGGYNNEVVIMYRILALKAKDAADTFRTVFGEAGGPINRVRGIFMWQYDNGASVVDALQMLDDWYNNADGITHVANPQPIKSYFWGGGGASYYNAGNGYGVQSAIVPANASFDLPALSDGQSVQNPSGSSWTYTGTAGMNRSGTNQRAYLTGTGEISQVVNFPAAGIYDFNFKISGDGQQVDVYVNGRKVNSNDAPDNMPMSFNTGTPYGANGEYTAYTMPFELTAPGSVTLRIVGRTAGKTAYIDQVGISSADVIYASGMPYFSANTSHERLMQIMVNFVKPYGLKNLIYEGGWSLSSDPSGGGSDVSTPLGKYIKYNDARSRTLNRENGEQLLRAGGALYCFGSFGQWSDTFDAPSQAIWQSFTDLADILPPTASNGFFVPTTVTPAVNTASRKYNNNQVNGRGWVSWNLIVPATSTYTFTVNTTGSGGLVQLQLEGTTVASGPSGTPLNYTATNLTSGLQSLTVRSGNSTAFTLTNVVVTQPGGPNAPTLNTAALSGAGVALTWTAPTSGPAIDGYTIRYGLSPNTYSGEIVLGNVTNFTVTGLTHAKDYYFTVIARSGSLSSVGSNERSLFYVAPGTPYWQTLDDRDPSVSYSSGWSQFGDGRHFKTTETYSGNAGSTSTFTFTGTKARFITATRSDRGIAEIYLDNALVGTVDTATNGGFQYVAFETPTLPLGVHQLKVRVTGTRSALSNGNAIVVDAFSFYHPGRTADPAPTITSALSANATGGSAFNYTITGSNTPTAFSAIGLPPGLSVNTATGAISGTPSSAGSFTVLISVANGGGSASGNLVITVATGGLSSAATPTISPNGGTFSAAQTVTLATSTSGATIRYTLDGTTPTSTSGTLYTAPFTVETIVALRAVAFKAGMLDSAPATANFVFSALPVATPVISPDSGSFSTPQTITITCATAGASIRYTTDGSTPNAGSTLYSAPFTASNLTNTIKAMAFKSGMVNSNVATATIYIVTDAAANPVISPSSGTFTTSPLVTITSATAGASIRYTTDGSTPTNSVGTLYSAPFYVSATSTIKAVAFKALYLDSAVTSASLTVNLPTAAMPTITPNGGTFNEAQSITIASSSPGTSIRYTIDGTTPTTTTGTLYTGAFDYYGPTGTIKAVAYGLDFALSPVASAAFTLNIPVTAAPVISPAGGSYATAQSVTITSATAGAAIRYTTDGSTPTSTTGTVYAGPVAVGSSQLLKAIAYKSGYLPSAVVSETYTIAGTMAGVSYESQSAEYTVSDTDLINGITPVVVGTSSLWTGNSSWTHFGEYAGSPGAPAVNDGAFSSGAAVGMSSGSTRANTGNAAGLDLVWNFDTPQDLASIALYFGWADSGRDNVPVVQIYASSTPYVLTNGPNPDGQMSTGAVDAGIAANGGFTLLATTVNTAPTTGNYSKVTVSPPAGNLASGVRSIYVRFGAAENDWVGFREIDVIPSVPLVAAADPVFTPAGGSYATAQPVTITSATAGASIRYTTDGSVPTSNTGTLYSGPVNVAVSQTLKAIAYRSGYLPSEVVSETYTITSVPPGVTYASQSAAYTVSTTDLINNVTPVVVGTGSLWTGNSSWTHFGEYAGSPGAPAVNDGAFATGAAVGMGSGNTRASTGNAGGLDLIWNFATPQDLTSIALYFGWADTGRDNVPVVQIFASSSEYVLTNGPNPDGFFSTGAVDAGVAANGGFTQLAAIVDTAPTTGTNSRVTVAPVTGNLATGVRSLYVRFGAAENAWVGLREIDVFGGTPPPVVADPVFAPAGGNYSAAQSVTITSATAGAAIRYTTDGSLPTSTTGTVYTGSINVGASQTLKAIAYKAASTDSAVVNASYVIAPNDYAAWAGANGVSNDPTGDSDNDGIKNLVEYALADGAERGTFNATTKNLSFTKRGAPYGSDITYAIEESINLTDWTVVSPLVNDATTISHTLSGGTTKFARLKVTQN